ncbi:transposase family protein [Providencia rettgeri]
MNPLLNERLVAIAHQAKVAGHGNKESIYQMACEELQMSRSTLLKALKKATYQPPRKQRSDAGGTTLSREEALTISAAWMESRRSNDKRLYSLKNIVNHLRTNDLIVAGRMDDATGEFLPLSVDAISRALRSYRLHYDQLQAPSPSLRLASHHPNHVWQIDASICVLYYLKNPNKRHKGKPDSGLRIMDAAEFNKNKPKNLERIVNDRVWSFEIIDHTTHWIYPEYRFGGESAENFLDVMINAMQARGGADVLQGIPQILYTDPGSALVSSSLLNMCKALGIRHIAHKAHNARATGAVEKARDIIECDFEAGLRFVSVNSIEQLNHYARLWRMHYNRTQIHSRYKSSRTDAWLKITAEQLMKAPSPEVCREMALSAPESRTVGSDLHIKYRTKEWDVRHLPNICVGDEIFVTRNPWHEDEARVVMRDEDGFECYHAIHAVTQSEWGYAETNPVIGECYGSMPTTTTEQHRAQVQQIAYGTHNEDETAAARKAKAIPFAGRFNPYKEMEDSIHPEYLPKQGQISAAHTVNIERKPLSHLEAAKRLRERFIEEGMTWSAFHYQNMSSRYPDGVPDTELGALYQALIASETTKVVNIR